MEPRANQDSLGQIHGGGSSHMKRRRLVRGLWVLVLCTALLAGFRVFLGDVYHVTSHSMEPTIRGATPGEWGGPSGGERVLVLYERGRTPKRFDLVVVEQEGQLTPAVKRVVGLPGESVRLVEGDVYVNGRVLGFKQPRPPPVILFDSTSDDSPAHFHSSGEAILAGRTWRMAAGAAPASATWSHRITDGYRTAGGHVIPGRVEVGDLWIALGLSWSAAPGELVVELTEHADRFVARLRFDGSHKAEIFLERFIAEASLVQDPSIEAPGAFQLLAQGELDARPGEKLELTFSNVDNALSLNVNGQLQCSKDYSANTAIQGAPDPAYRHLARRVRISVPQGSLVLQRVRIGRDLHFTPRGRFAADGALVLGPDEVFLLGDNSSESVDGRDWGPTPIGKLIGKPWRVVWPWRLARALVERANELR